jgi:hypothetical protein
MVALIYKIFPKMWYAFGLLSSFHLAFPTIALTPHVREPVCGFCCLLGISIPIPHSGNGNKLPNELGNLLGSLFRPELKLHQPLDF